MIDQLTIDSLKENEKPFGLMSKEMQDRLLQIEGLYDNDHKPVEIFCGGKWQGFGHLVTDDTDASFRLRADYEEKQEVVKLTVFEHNGLLKYCPSNDDRIKTEFPFAVSNPDFIGFLYEGNRISTSPRLYEDGDYYETLIKTDRLQVYEVLTPTHVLFRSK